MTKVIDASNRVIGRLASEIAQEALDGEEVRVVNSEEAVVSGDTEQVLDEYKTKHDRGVRDRGPHFPKSPERILKRSLRGMVPYKEDRGKEALSRVKAYIGVPHEFEDDVEEVDTKSGDELQNRNYVKLGKVSRHIGWEPVGER
ncbi:50S ribosomal protein L13 [Candidatus Nanosalina sp. VS9-1]|uniref:50S ribosomal protein L13 n=1 Tax=Candidatus Nanosalina sp. VS9-1 TaxID=3388566 RepID=UPI0039DFE51F